jgi:hypothetical protein
MTFVRKKKSLILKRNISLSSPKYPTEEDAYAGEGRGEVEGESSLLMLEF